MGNRCPNYSRVVLGHESLDVTLAYLKGKYAESEEAQEHANSSRLGACTRDGVARGTFLSNDQPYRARVF
jgi:hypothetical protein